MNQQYNPNDDDENFPMNFNESDFSQNMPLDDFFNVNNVQEVVENANATVESPIYDEKDLDLDRELSEIAAIAKKTIDAQQRIALSVEPKFRGELLGVANNMLTTALQAIKEKADIKKHKDKLSVGKGGLQIGNSEVTNIIVADRNELLKNRKKEQ